ncbi:MAG TPA: flagellar biosynthetic protein FliO [Tepidisphaeraceae bacterium]|nr:flagellar biosynthetic protein FliO [Tepidisphaeraceae bacterium]
MAIVTAANLPSPLRAADPAAITPATTSATTRESTRPTTTAPAGAHSTRPGRGPGGPLDDLPTYGAAIRKALYVLAGIVAALLLAAKLLPRLMKSPAMRARGGGAGAGGARLLTVVESQRIEPQKTLYLVKVGDQFFLVGSTSTGLEALSGGPLDHDALAVAIRAAGTKSADDNPSAPKRAFGEVLRGKRGE